MAYFFCIIVNISALVTIAWLAFLFTRGASLWLIIAIIILSIRVVIPGSDIFTCPKCGYIERVKVFKTHIVTLTQEDDG